MSRLKRFSLFAFEGSTVASGIVATLHFSPLVSALSLLLALPIVLLTYYTVRTGWEDQGLYAHVRRANSGLSRAFLVLWFTGYYLYVVYTTIYVPYYGLGLNGVVPIVLSLAISSFGIPPGQLRRPPLRLPGGLPRADRVVPPLQLGARGRVWPP